ncbi:hypothetical protein C8R47DRAFT_1130336, partial [Mycena vitilis]
FIHDIFEHFDPTSHPVENLHMQPHSWFLDGTSVLREVRSVSNAMNWRDIIARSNLVSITLCDRIHNLDWTLFETLFAESPNLTTLRLQEITDFVLPPAGSLTSPSLAFLFLEFPISVLPGHMHLLAQRLSMPQLVHLVLRCESWDEPGFLRDCHGLLTSVRTLRIQGAWMDHAAMAAILPLLLMVSDLDLADSPGAFHALRDWSSARSVSVPVLPLLPLTRLPVGHVGFSTLLSFLSLYLRFSPYSYSRITTLSLPLPSRTEPNVAVLQALVSECFFTPSYIVEY